MNKDMKQRWIEALRSGDYKQGKGILHRPADESYCCLGVLNNIEKLEFPGASIFRDSVLEEIGLSPKEQTSLIIMNDKDNRSFEDIANYIEENL